MQSSALEPIPVFALLSWYMMLMRMSVPRIAVKMRSSTRRKKFVRRKSRLHRQPPKAFALNKSLIGTMSIKYASLVLWSYLTIVLEQKIAQNAQKAQLGAALTKSAWKTAQMEPLWTPPLSFASLQSNAKCRLRNGMSKNWNVKHALKNKYGIRLPKHASTNAKPPRHTTQQPNNVMLRRFKRWETRQIHVITSSQYGILRHILANYVLKKHLSGMKKRSNVNRVHKSTQYLTIQQENVKKKYVH